MNAEPPHRYDDLDAAPPWPLSRLYHENSNLSERRLLEFKEQIGSYASSGGALGPSTAATTAQFLKPPLGLPATKRRLFGTRLDDALRSRRTQRGPLPAGTLHLRRLAALLELSVGVTGALELQVGAALETPPLLLRAYPSAGALYPLEIYLVALDCVSVEPAIYWYDPAQHAIRAVASCPERGALARWMIADDAWATATAAIVITGVFERTQVKYGERGYRFVLLEAGHAAQNLLLVAQSLGLPAIALGGICELELGQSMGLDTARESPLYAILLGGRHR